MPIHSRRVQPSCVWTNHPDSGMQPQEKSHCACLNLMRQIASVGRHAQDLFGQLTDELEKAAVYVDRLDARLQSLHESHARLPDPTTLKMASIRSLDSFTRADKHYSSVGTKGDRQLRPTSNLLTPSTRPSELRAAWARCGGATQTSATQTQATCAARANRNGDADQALPISLNPAADPTQANVHSQVVAIEVTSGQALIRRALGRQETLQTPAPVHRRQTRTAKNGYPNCEEESIYDWPAVPSDSNLSESNKQPSSASNGGFKDAIYASLRRKKPKKCSTISPGELEKRETVVVGTELCEATRLQQPTGKTRKLSLPLSSPSQVLHLASTLRRNDETTSPRFHGNVNESAIAPSKDSWYCEGYRLDFPDECCHLDGRLGRNLLSGDSTSSSPRDPIGSSSDADSTRAPSAGSCDYEGYYTSMHADAGLRQRVNPQRPSKLLTRQGERSCSTDSGAEDLHSAPTPQLSGGQKAVASGQLADVDAWLLYKFEQEMTLNKTAGNMTTAQRRRAVARTQSLPRQPRKRQPVAPPVLTTTGTLPRKTVRFWS